MKNKNVFYFCSINTPAYEMRINEKLFVGAAHNKVSRLVEAFRFCGYKGSIISLPVLNKEAGNLKSIKKHVFKSFCIF